MTDIELLERAAKAAGVDLEWSTMDGVSPRNRDGWNSWNPLTDDGDALRLAVRLDMGVEVMLSLNESRAGDGDQEPVAERHNGDPYAATRRAIVRAAAMREETL